MSVDHPEPPSLRRMPEGVAEAMTSVPGLRRHTGGERLGGLAASTVTIGPYAGLSLGEALAEMLEHQRHHLDDLRQALHKQYAD